MPASLRLGRRSTDFRLQNMVVDEDNSGRDLKVNRLPKRGGFFRGRYWWVDAFFITLFVVCDGYAFYWFSHRFDVVRPRAPIAGQSDDMQRQAAILRPVQHIPMPSGSLGLDETCYSGRIVRRSMENGAAVFVQLPGLCSGRFRY